MDSIRVTSAGHYILTVTSTGLAPVMIRLQCKVKVNPKPTANITNPTDTVFCLGDSLDIQANTGAGLTYQWLFQPAATNGATNSTSASAISGATESSYYAKQTGTYKVVVTNTYQCHDTSFQVPLKADSVTVNGKVTISGTDSAVTAGKVRLYTQATGQPSKAIDSASIDNTGAYSLKKVGIGTYYVLAVPDTTTNKGLAPTYYTSATVWDGATVLTISNCKDSIVDNINISVS